MSQWELHKKIKEIPSRKQRGLGALRLEAASKHVLRVRHGPSSRRSAPADKSSQGSLIWVDLEDQNNILAAGVRLCVP